MASNPEFLREGRAVHDFFHPDRIVLGVPSQRAGDLLGEVYAPFHCPKVITDPNTAEIIKHACNSFLALKISYINLIAELCERTQTDVHTVAQAMGLDQRIGPGSWRPGWATVAPACPRMCRRSSTLARARPDFSLLKEADAINAAASMASCRS